MNLVLLELILWGTLLLFFWALKEALEKVESDIESLKIKEQTSPATTLCKRSYSSPEKVEELIGSYKGAPIHQVVFFKDQVYYFDHIQFKEEPLMQNQLCITPGLVYTRAEQLK